MPMIALTTTADITPGLARQLAAGFGEAITLIPGQSDLRLMFTYTSGAPMYLEGQVRSAAFVEVSTFGNAPPEAYEAFTAATVELLERVLEMQMLPENILIKYSETILWYGTGITG